MVTFRFTKSKQSLEDADKLRRIIPDVCLLESQGLLTKNGYSSIRNGGVKVDKSRNKLTIAYLDASSPVICRPGSEDKNCLEVEVNVVKPRQIVNADPSINPSSIKPVATDLPKSSSEKIDPPKPVPVIPTSSGKKVNPKSSARPPLDIQTAKKLK